MTDQFIGRVLAEKYRVDSLIREGDFANFYHGTHLLMEKPVAIKILSPRAATRPDSVTRFANEARTVSRIFHQNILNVTDYGSDEFGMPFIVFEDAEGRTLKDAIENEGAFSPGRANKIIKQIASALAAAHKQGLTHMNLRSDNVLLKSSFGDGEEVKVFNFGLGRLNNADSAGMLPPSKAAYLSPEQSAGNAADERSDIYSLGIILYEMLSGHLPFSSNDSQELMAMHLEQLPPPLSDFGRNVPSGVEEVMLGSLAKNPDLRYQSVTAFAEDLDGATPAGAFSDEEGTVIQSRADALAGAKPENNIWKTAFIVLAGITLLGGGLIYMTQVKQTNPGTALATDANGQPVQPVNPSTGAVEQGLSNMSGYNPDLYGNSNTPGVIPGGDGYDPWSNPGRPPGGGAPSTSYGPGVPIYPVTPGQPGGPPVYIDPNTNSPFMMPDQGNIIVRVPVNSNVNTAPTPKTGKPAANSNTVVIPPANTAPANTTVKPPAANTAAPTEPKATPTPKTKAPKTPAKPPAEQPKPEPKPEAPPSATEKKPQSGKVQDTN